MATLPLNLKEGNFEDAPIFGLSSVLNIFCDKDHWGDRRLSRDVSIWAQRDLDLALCGGDLIEMKMKEKDI